jgi:predicted alpha-1,2-mannosidase
MTLPIENYAKLVNPLTATEWTRWFYFAAASHPFGMINLSPDTTAKGDWGSGYRYSNDRIQAFSHAHGWQIAALPMMPTLGAFKGTLGLTAWETPFDHQGEVAEAGYHKVKLPALKTTVEMTSTTRVGITRYTFEKEDQAHINFDLAAELGPSEMGETVISKINQHSLEGYLTNLPTRRRPKALKIYFVVETDRKDSRLQIWQNGELLDETTTIRGTGIGFSWSSDVKAGEQIQTKAAIAYTSVEQARKNLDLELPGWDFDAVRAEAQQTWNAMLGRIRVKGSDETKKRKFYTDLFHGLLGRRTVSDVDGKYFDHTTDQARIRQIPLKADGTPEHAHYNSDAMWGAQWAINQLWPLAYPEITSGFCKSFLNMYRDGGLIPRGPSGGNYTFVMTGASSTPLFASAYQKGIRDFDTEAAFEGLKKNHLPGGLMSKAGYEHNTCIGGGIEFYIDRGYVPSGIKADAFHCCGATQTLEYSFEDWALSEMAASMNKPDEATQFARRSGNYKNLWNPDNEFLQPRNMDGSWLADYDPMSPEGWEEGNGWQYLFRATHDIEGLAELMGGREQAVERLDQLMRDAEKTDFVAPHDGHHLSPLDFGNQPSTFYAHVFNHLGAYEKSQYWVRKVYETCKSGVSPERGYGGDEDQGLMGSLNCMFALGLFDINGGCGREPGYYLTAPIFDEIEVDLNPDYYSGDTFTITSSPNPESKCSIDSIRVNGIKSEIPYISHADLVAGAKVEVALANTIKKNVQFTTV